jgi:uncharacterized repeat protein (TIGR01451 family)
MTTTVDDTDPSHYFGADIDIHIEKATNGQDADAPTGPVVLVGGLVTWTYTVTNPGNVPLSNIVVTDDQGGVTPVYQSGDANLNSVLDTTETWIYEATGTAVAGQYANQGTANGDFMGTPVNDTDPSHYFGANPVIDIEKATNGQDADTPTGPIVPVGSLVTWTYTVTNPGNVPLSNIVVTDDQGVTPIYQSGDTNTDDILDTTETWIYEATGTAVAGQYTNYGTVTTDEGPTDTDPSNYFGEVVVEYYEETAYGLNDALGPVCFLDLGFSNWGWTHGPLDPLDRVEGFEFELWAGAAHCDTDEGFYAGQVTVYYDGTGATIERDIDPPYEIIAEHVYIGSTQVPHKGKGSSPQETVAPGQYYIEQYIEVGYIIYHAVVQWSDE